MRLTLEGRLSCSHSHHEKWWRRRRWITETCQTPLEMMVYHLMMICRCFLCTRHPGGSLPGRFPKQRKQTKLFPTDSNKNNKSKAIKQISRFGMKTLPLLSLSKPNRADSKVILFRSGDTKRWIKRNQNRFHLRFVF